MPSSPSGPAPMGGTVLERVLTWVESTPDAPAVIDADDTSTTYGALWERALHFAGQLQIEPGEPIGVRTARSADLPAAFLAILLAGGVYVPLNPDDNDEYVEGLLDRVGARSVFEVTSQGLTLRHRGAQPVRSFHSDDAQDRPIYVMFTSGSTGRPKAVVTTHRGVLQLVDERDFDQIEAGGRMGNASNQMFDATTWEIWVALCNGATIVVIETEDLLSHERLERRIADQSITCLFLSTSLFNHHARVNPGLFGGLTSLAVGGEALHPAHIRSVLTSPSPPRRLLNGYGPTECTTFSTWGLVEEVPEGATTVPIGRPFARTEVAIVDQDGRPLPDGEVGELWIGGDGVALEYLDQEEQTAERFPCVALPGFAATRWFRSGDLAYVDTTGRLICLGRADRQVKILGQRVEISEIEERIGSCRGVAHVAIIDERTNNSTRLVAFIVRNEAPLDRPAINQQLRGIIEGSVVPARLLVIDQIPLTKNGKLDGDELRRIAARSLEEAVGSETTSTQRDDLEPFVLACASEVLGVDVRALDEDLAVLGLDSLALVELMVLLSEGGFGDATAWLPPGDLTPLSLIAALRESRRRERSDLVELNVAAEGPPWFCFPGAGDTALSFRPLAQQAPDRPIVVVEPHGMHTEGGPDRTVEAAARRALPGILDRAGDGPIVLLGFSSGGVLAYEVAQQLVELGVTPRVVLADTIFPGSLFMPPLKRWGRTVVRLKALRDARRIAAGHGGLALYRAVNKVQIASMFRYRAAPPRFAVLWCHIQPAEGLAPWSFDDPHVTYVTASGEHLTMMKDPHVGDLARKVCEWEVEPDRASVRDPRRSPPAEHQR